MDLFSSVFVFAFVMSVYCSLVVTCWGRADLLALLVWHFLVLLSFSHMLSWVGCGTSLYRFLIFVFSHTLVKFTLYDT